MARMLHVGNHDLSEEELEFARSSKGRHALLDTEWAAARLEGGDLLALVREHVARLPPEVWITFEVDGLDRVEVSPGETPASQDSWGAIVGARLLYHLIGCALAGR